MRCANALPGPRVGGYLAAARRSNARLAVHHPFPRSSVTHAAILAGGTFRHRKGFVAEAGLAPSLWIRLASALRGWIGLPAALASETAGGAEAVESAGAEAVRRAGFAEEAIPHMDAVFRFALRLTRGRQDEAEDLVQDTYLQAYRAWDSYTPGTNCRSWLFTIARNRFLRNEERRGRRPEVPESQLDAAADALAAGTYGPVDTTDPERGFWDSFIDAEVLAAVDRLPTPFREAVVLSDVEGLSYPELAEVLGLPVGTVKSRLFRGRRLLQKALYDYAAENGYVRGELAR
jgi:RNA polymerase sigma-70 factor (ECF subfamily)